MISQNNNNLLKLILYDSNYLLPMPVALSEGIINEKERRKKTQADNRGDLLQKQNRMG